MVQLLVCDWLLTTRTDIWQRECQNSREDDDVSSSTAISAGDLKSFQVDLSSLRKLAYGMKLAMPRVSLECPPLFVELIALAKQCNSLFHLYWHGFIVFLFLKMSSYFTDGCDCKFLLLVYVLRFLSTRYDCKVQLLIRFCFLPL